MVNSHDMNIWKVAKVSHSKSSSKINIPIDIARATGIDKTKYVLIIKRGKNRLEVRRYAGTEDLKEYI